MVVDPLRQGGIAAEYQSPSHHYGDEGIYRVPTLLPILVRRGAVEGQVQASHAGTRQGGTIVGHVYERHRYASESGQP